MVDGPGGVSDHAQHQHEVHRRRESAQDRGYVGKRVEWRSRGVLPDSHFHVHQRDGEADECQQEEESEQA